VPLAREPIARQSSGMFRFLMHWLITGLSLVVADWALDGLVVRSGPALVFGALVLGLVNALVRPALVVLTLPLTIVTLGLFYLVVNGVAFALAAWLVPGFDVAGFGSAMLGALVVAIVSWALGSLRDRR
jgi:putative membrane protein